MPHEQPGTEHNVQAVIRQLYSLNNDEHVEIVITDAIFGNKESKIAIAHSAGVHQSPLRQPSNQISTRHNGVLGAYVNETHCWSHCCVHRPCTVRLILLRDYLVQN